MRLVYGVFNHREPAEQALEHLHKQESAAKLEDVSNAAIHDHMIRNVDLPRSGNFALRSALVGGVVVAGCVGLLIGLLMFGAFEAIGGPSTILGSDSADMIPLVLAVGVFGGIVAGIAGSAGNRARVRRLTEELAKGRVILTLEAPARRARARPCGPCGSKS